MGNNHEPSTEDQTVDGRTVEEVRDHYRQVTLRAYDTGAFEVDTATMQVTIDDVLAQIHGLPLGEVFTFEKMQSVIYPEDSEKEQEAFGLAMDPSGTGEVKSSFRIFPLDGAEIRWVELISTTIFNNGAPVRLIGTIQDITVRREQEHNTRLIHELEHRVKNTLATAVAVIELSRRGQVDVDSYFNVISSRVRSMATSQDALLSGKFVDIPLSDCVRREAASFVGNDASRFSHSGPEIRIQSKNTLIMNMVFHELFTNASKHGALSTPDGTIHLTTAITDDTVTLTWTETGGPEITGEPTNEPGFGTTLLTQILPAEVGATVTRTFDNDSFHCEISIPRERTST